MKFKFSRKKLTFRRFSYYLFIITIVVSCIANGIFAKFTTEDYGGDGGRVADFGVIVNISGDLFSSVYNMNTDTEIKDGDTTLLLPEDSNNPTIITSDDKTISVKAATNADGSYDNVVAPGTKNDVGINVSVTGMPETDYELSYVLSNFETVYLSSGLGAYGTSYGLMVELEDGIVNETNFNKIVEKNNLYTSDDDKTYTKVESTDAFDGNKTYFKLKDTVIVPANESYMPIKYYVNVKTDDSTTSNLLNSSYKCNSDYVKTTLLGKFIEHTFENGTAEGMSYNGYASGSEKFETNVEISKNFNFTWEWPYHQVEETDSDYDWCNACDTILGYIAAGKNVVKGIVKSDGSVDAYESNLASGNDYNLDIIFDYSITVDQVD